MLKLLNDSQATELVCVHCYPSEEQGHADEIADRIAQLGGEPDFAAEGLVSRCHAENVEGHSLASMIKEALVAEQIAGGSCRDIIQYLGSQDPTTRRMTEGILAVEKEHADELAILPVAFPDESERKRRAAKSK